MQTKKLAIRLALLGLTCASTRLAAAFDCGSTGAYGPINVQADTTLDMPADGVFNCTTITVAPGTTLRFNKNPLNTPVYLLATGDVLINGTLDVSGRSYNGVTNGVGGPGGFNGGYGGTALAGYTAGGDGLGPGGGKNQPGWMSAAHAQVSGSNLRVYGNSWLSPLIGGSGGAGGDGNPGYGGGGGGGAILVASDTKITVNGTLRAIGGSGVYSYPTWYAGYGSGGAIRLAAPVVGGVGGLDTVTTYGSPGRIRIDCTDDYSFRALNLSGVSTRGSRMVVFPPVVPRLDIIEAAGQTIPEGAPSPVQIALPAGSATNRTVKVQARNFTNNVPIRLAIIPVNGPSTNYDTTIDITTGNPPSTNLNVVIPAGTICRIQAWTR